MNLEKIVKQAQENMNVKEQLELGWSLDYLKSSEYFVECAKREIGHITFSLEIELTYTLLDKLLEMFFSKEY